MPIIILLLASDIDHFVLSLNFKQIDRLKYITQAKTRPPGFVLSCSRPEALPASYVRYLTNALREDFDLPGIPIRIMLRTSDNPFAHKAKRRR